MRALTFIDKGKIDWREAPEAHIETGIEAVVRPSVIGRCDLDLAYVQGLAPMPSGAPIGHEMIGEVVEIGDDVERFQPGDRVVVPAQISCGRCRNCHRGFTGRCQSVPFGASYAMGREGNFGGAAADRVRVPFADVMLFPLPEAAEALDWIGFADMAQDGYRAVGPQLAERIATKVFDFDDAPEAWLDAELRTVAVRGRGETS